MTQQAISACRQENIVETNGIKGNLLAFSRTAQYSPIWLLIFHIVLPICLFGPGQLDPRRFGHLAISRRYRNETRSDFTRIEQGIH